MRHGGSAWRSRGSGGVRHAESVAVLRYPGTRLTAKYAPGVLDSAFVVDGYQITRVDKTTGVTSVLAGSVGERGCVDAAAGSQARFSDSAYVHPRIVGSDGTFVYASDSCGLRRVDAATGFYAGGPALLRITKAIGDVITIADADADADAGPRSR
jgi:hypothetical protein